MPGALLVAGAINVQIPLDSGEFHQEVESSALHRANDTDNYAGGYVVFVAISGYLAKQFLPGFDSEYMYFLKQRSIPLLISRRHLSTQAQPITTDIDSLAQAKHSPKLVISRASLEWSP